MHFQGIPARRPARLDDGLVPAGQAGWTAPPLTSIVGGLPALVLTHAGLDPAAYRCGPLERRFGACLRALRADSEQAAARRLTADPESRGVALSALLIGVSSFFRDADVFDTIRSAVVPALRERPGTIRVWSIGCSTGAELYSIGMILDEAGLLDRAELLGTDCRADIVARARSATFSTEELADLDAKALSRFFERAHDGWRVAPFLRRVTRWEIADATREMSRGPWDLVLCRNLLIYLHSSPSEAMFRGIAERLSSGGFLVTGKAERAPAWLPVSPVGRCVYRTRSLG